MNDTLRMSHFVEQFYATYERSNPDAGEKAEESANVRVVRSIYETLLRGDLAGVGAAMTDDVVLEIVGPPHSAIAGRTQGRAEVLETLRRNFSLFADQFPELEHVVANGNSVIVVAEETGRYVPTGEPYNIWWLQAFVIRDGKIARVREVVSGTGPWEQHRQV